MAGEKKPHRFAVGNTWGRPPKYENEDEFAQKVLEYFQECENSGDKPTITGLCLFMGFESRGSFDKQAERSPEFSYIVKRAKMIVENRYEELLVTVSVGGAIFALKNMGWTDKVEQVGGVTVNVEQKTEFVNYDKLSDAALEEIASLESDPGAGGTGEA